MIARGDAEPLLAVVWKNRHGRFMVLGILIDGVRLSYTGFAAAPSKRSDFTVCKISCF